ncbi:MAG: 3-deoxy-D-manno-octulosonic acid transferase [Flavobacteriales bacterium]|nr:3-deoxy-D-manno-octulosonic acid transferase [Flavobacteriales bacterium]MCB9190628.1 3-deoxy-D-manno-octulosonic acid transferase [Flavobacteriales bacterium]
MLLFYNIGIRLYGLGIRVAALFNSKAKKWVDGRKGLLEKIEQETASFSGETLWVHCASLGEFEMARPIMEQLKQADSNLRIVLTFFSPSGYEVRKNYEVADHVFYLPLDPSSNAKRFVKAIKPTKVIFVKYDLWFHHLNEAKKFGAKLMLISATFREGQQYFKFYGGIGRKALQLFDRIFLVDADSENLIHSIGIKNTTVCGDTRYDRVMEIASAAESNTIIESFKGNSKLIICGSTWKEDEEVLKDSIKNLKDVKWVIAPHEVGEENIQRLQKLLPDSVRYSQYHESNARILIIDSIGLLNKLYRYADVAYIGGGFRTGLHNVFEAAAFGVPAVFGPDTSRFPDAAEMAKKGLAFRIQNKSEFHSKLSELVSSDQSQLRTDIKDFMTSRTGATKAILEYTNNC